MSFNGAKFFILGFTGHTLNSDFAKFIESNPPAGFLLLGENYKDEKQLGGLISGLKAIAGVDALITVDQEPGRVQRFKDGFPVSKKPRHYLKAGNIPEYKEWCTTTAEKMAELGINVNLAPMVDLWPLEKDYAVLNDRSFGDEPDRVAEFAGILIEEFRKFHILTCAKHFPGLGSAKGDPHSVLSTSNEKLEHFLDYHWRPFKQAVISEVAMIMTTHLLCPALDSQNCATYSGNVISHLRNTVGHRGVIVSDDLYMAGAQTGRDAGQAACDSLYAGHNLLIISRDLEFQREAVSAVKKRFEEDEAFGKIASEYDKRLKALRNAR